MTGARCWLCGAPVEDVDVSANGRPYCEDCLAEVQAGGRRLRTTPASLIRSKRVRWVWDGRMPRAALSLVAGEKGLGKSLLTNADIPAKLTRGELEGELFGTPADVLIATVEDSWEGVIKARLVAHGADLDRIHRVEVEDETGRMLVTLPDDVDLFARRVDRLRERGANPQLLVIDPIAAFIPDRIDSYKDAAVRRALAPLAGMAEDVDIAAAVVMHLTKDDSQRLVSRVSGSVAFVNAARSVLAMVRDPDDPDGEQGTRRVLVHVASNWGAFADSLSITVTGREVKTDEGESTGVGHLEIGGATVVGIEDLQREAISGGTAHADRRDAIITALRDRDYRRADVPGGLEGPVAYCMALLAQVKGKDRCLDPMCGGGRR